MGELWFSQELKASFRHFLIFFLFFNMPGVHFCNQCCKCSWWPVLKAVTVVCSWHSYEVGREEVGVGFCIIWDVKMFNSHQIKVSGYRHFTLNSDCDLFGSCPFLVQSEISCSYLLAYVDSGCCNVFCYEFWWLQKCWDIKSFIFWFIISYITSIARC